MNKCLLLLPLLTLACAQAPKKTYQWVSLSEQGFTQNSVTVLKESKQFQNDGGYENLEIKKQKLADTDVSIVPLKRDVQKIVLIGDTGCRLKEASFGNTYQNCKDPNDWNYPGVVASIAAEKPDLIIHVGDYHYREQCSPGQPCRKMTDTIGYGWKNWEEDFFKPSEKGFQTAPWIFVRGNHEECKRAFEGYKLISEQKWDKACVDQEKTEYIQLKDLLIVQLDSSSITDNPDKTEVEAYWEQQFKDIEAHVKNNSVQQIWLITHKPLVGLTINRKEELVTLNAHLHKAFAKTNLRKKISLMIAGHIHNTQVTEADQFPLQLVVGNSGTALDNIKAFHHPETIINHKIDDVKIKDFSTDLKSNHSFGYAVLTKAPQEKNWSLQLKDLQGKTTMSFIAEVQPDKSMDKKMKSKKVVK